MTTSSWIDALRGQVAGASARTDSMFAKLHEEQRQLGAQLDKLVDRLGNAVVARETKVDSLLHERVLDAIRTGRSHTLSPREQRYGAKQFELVSPDEMKTLLQSQPSCWQRFATECFRRWEVFEDTRDRTGYARLLCLAPSSVSFLHQTGRPQELVTRDAPATIADLIRGNDLVQARLALQQRGFDPSWSFTATVLATSLRFRASQRGLFGATWESLKRDLVTEAMLLPRMPDPKQSWFAKESRPAKVRGSTLASAMVVSTLISAAYESGADPVHWGEFTEKLLSSELGDPRVPPESKGWAKTRAYDEPAYLRFLGSLISDDLEIFFAHAMTEARRKAFWLKYLSSIRRTVCILDRSAYARLKTTLAGADKKLAAALSRARQFVTKGGSSSAQAFCLYFDSVVIVEFSETGNAMYIYDRRVFEQQFQADIYSNRCSAHTVLKVQRLARERLVHTHANWEAETRASLFRIGISPDRANAT